jgi:hypothetical protein
MWDVDFMHPIDPGMAAISDMVAFLMQQTALSLLLNPLNRADRTLLQEQVPEPMFKGEQLLRQRPQQSLNPGSDAGHSRHGPTLPRYCLNPLVHVEVNLGALLHTSLGHVSKCFKNSYKEWLLFCAHGYFVCRELGSQEPYVYIRGRVQAAR